MTPEEPVTEPTSGEATPVAEPSATSEGAPTMSDETTTIGYSYEYGVDVKVGSAGTDEDWQPVRFISAVNPTVTAKEEDGATYDDHGADHPIRTGETAQLEFYVQLRRLANGNFLPEVEALLAAAGPDGEGGKPITVRYYDKPVAGTANPKEAFELVCTVSVANRANTANSGIAGWNFTLKGQGPRKRITNPANKA